MPATNDLALKKASAEVSALHPQMFVLRCRLRCDYVAIDAAHGPDSPEAIAAENAIDLFHVRRQGNVHSWKGHALLRWITHSARLLGTRQIDAFLEICQGRLAGPCHLLFR